jgi:hypothetical protein
MDSILSFLDGFITWQTPVSFMAGIGIEHLCKRLTNFIRDRRSTMFTRKSDGTYRFSTRFWVYSVIATLVIAWIGWRTQMTANEVERQAATTSQFSEDTNKCLTDVVAVLTTRIGYNEVIESLDKRRQDIWEQLVTDLAIADNSTGLNQAALDRFSKANALLKADQARLIRARESNQYPNCGKKPS